MRVGVRVALFVVGLLAGGMALATWRSQAGAADATQTLPRGEPAAPAARLVDRHKLMHDAATLAAPAFEGRATGTPGGLRARQWIVDQFAAIGMAPLNGSEYAQPFVVEQRELRAILPGGRPFRTVAGGANVIGRIAGRDPDTAAIVVTAHYDHLGLHDGHIYPGADDNASGVAVLLAAARHFAARPARRPIVFGALDAEEIGLHGARALVRSPLLPRRSIALNINLDMVSRSAAREIYAAGAYHSPWLAPVLADVQRRAGVRLLLGHDRPSHLSGGLEDWTHASDHGPFHDANVPFVYFGVEDHPDYHRPTDTVDRIDPEFFGAVADMVIDAVQTFDARLK